MPSPTAAATSTSRRSTPASTRPPTSAIADALAVAEAAGRLRARAHLVRAALDRRLLGGPAARARRARAPRGHGPLPALRDDRPREARRSATRTARGQVEFLERVGMVGEDVVLAHCCAMDADDIAALARQRHERRPLPDRPGEDGQRRHAGPRAARRRRQRLARHRRGRREQRRRPDPRPEVGRLPAEAASHRDATVVTRRARARDGDDRRRPSARHRPTSSARSRPGKRADFIVVRTDGAALGAEPQPRRELRLRERRAPTSTPSWSTARC